MAEAHAARSGGWTTSRHYSVPTTDVPVRLVPGLREWFNARLRTRLFPLLARCFSRSASVNGEAFDAANVRQIDAFVVKYEAGEGAQASLPVHADQSQFSFTVALNGRGDYDGGGTYLADLGRAVVADQGHALAFPGSLVHGGQAISRGTRYIIASFCYVDGFGE
jgi:hypothetical protein